MKHIITINGTEYTLRMQGTVGIHMLAEKIVPDVSERHTIVTATDDNGNETTTEQPTSQWLMALLYATFVACNKEASESIDFVDFTMSFNSKEFADAITWYYKAYAEREGLLTVPVDSSANTEDEKNA